MQETQHLPPHTATVLPGAGRSVVSWGAVLAGAVIGAALSAMLVVGGSGLGFLAASPWQNEGASGTAIATGTIIWLLITQIIAYGLAGYVTGRLRTRWADTPVDEIYFRDTAHGFLVWAVSVVVSLTLLATAAASIAAGTAKTGAALIGAGASTAVAAMQGNGEDFSLEYFSDRLLRAETASPEFEQDNARQEVRTILLRSVAEGELSEEDRSYLVRVVADRAGIDEATAEQRLTQAWDQAVQTLEEAEQTAREAADAARKAAATFSLWSFISLLLGAFIASFAATIGGRARDN